MTRNSAAFAAAFLLACGIQDAPAGTTDTPRAREEIEKYQGPYPGDRYMELRAIYKEYLRAAGFEQPAALRDLAYGPDERQRLDVLRPKNPEALPVPILVFVHGGAFVRGNRSDGEIFDNVLSYFTRHGVLGINMSYRLAPRHRWPAAAEDLRDVIRWIRANAAEYGGDADRIYLMGHSAGAVHVATYAFTEDLQAEGGDDGVRGAILMSGIYGSGDAAASGHVYFGDDPELVAERVPLAHTDGRRMPLFVIDAEHDPLPMQTSAIALIGAICRRDGKCPRHQQIAGHNHYSMTYHINTADDSIAADILDFIRRHSRDD